MTYDEPEPFCINDLHYDGTRSQAREISLRVRNSPEWRRWSVLDDLVQRGTFDALAPASRRMCEELTDAALALTNLTARIIHDVTRTE